MSRARLCAMHERIDDAGTGFMSSVLAHHAKPDRWLPKKAGRPAPTLPRLSICRVEKQAHTSGLNIVTGTESVRLRHGPAIHKRAINRIFIRQPPITIFNPNAKMPLRHVRPFENQITP